MGQNLLAEAPSLLKGQEKDEEEEEEEEVGQSLQRRPKATSSVTYGYDRTDSPPATFQVSIFFASASLQITEGLDVEIATFAMRRATLNIGLLSPFPLSYFKKYIILTLLFNSETHPRRSNNNKFQCGRARPSG